MRASLLVFMTMLFSMQLSGQASFELGLFFGASNYAGDLVPSYAPHLGENGPSAGLVVRSSISQKFTVRGNLLLATLSGDDNNYQERLGRGLSFNSNVLEMSAVVEWEPFGRNRYHADARGNIGIHNIVSPYIFGGFGMGASKYEVDASRSKNKEEWAARIQEDKSVGNSSAFVSVPTGLGIKFDMSDHFVISAEFGMHFTFTDYLDGVSIAGESNFSDWYYTGGVIMSYRFFSR